MAFIFLSLLAIVLSYLFIVSHKKRHFFKDLGIPQPPELPFLGIFGANMFIGPHVNHLMKTIYNVNTDAKYIGCHWFLKPVIVIRDLELVKDVLVKHFDHFADNNQSLVDETSDPLYGKNLAFLNGDRWWEMRNLLSPAFTSSKLRAMYTLMTKCAEQFSKRFVERYRDADAVDMKDAFTRYANDVIATSAFGIEVDSLTDANNDFYINGKKSLDFGMGTLIKIFLLMAFPKLKHTGIRMISKETTDFFVNVIESTIRVRKEKGIVRPDMLQLLIDASESDTAKDLDTMEITAQAFIFFLGGFDTTSNQLCMIAHELAVNPEVQKKLQLNIDALMERTNGEPSYEDVNSMSYLDAVLSEVLRVHPIGFIYRVCTKEFKLLPCLPDAEPYVIKPGEEIMVPVSGIHADPDYYAEPEKFHPDRFLDSKSTSSLAFGMGPRMCIGNRFAILEIKVLLVHLLHKCTLEPCAKTGLPLQYAKSSLMPIPAGGSWLKIKPRN